MSAAPAIAAVLDHGRLFVGSARLYEQERSAVLPVAALEMYVKRWVRWSTGGMVIPRAAAARTGRVAALGRVDVGFYRFATEAS